MLLHLDPVPASRPRFRVVNMKSGKSFVHTYHAGRYKKFLEDAEQAIPPCDPFDQLPGHVRVEIVIHVQKPKTSKLSRPRGDLDNYVKGILDVLTRRGYWLDDDEITVLIAEKFFTTSGGRISVEISPA